MIRRVCWFETRGQCAPAHARQALEEPECRAAIQALQASHDPVAKCGAPALMAFQFHVIGRVDDCCKWLKTNFGFHPQHHETTLKACLAWSKNVTEEHHAPWQFLLASMGTLFCVHLNLALWLEVLHSCEADGQH